jgi:hypothetical protein
MSEHKHLLDWLAWGFAGVAAVSLSQLSYIVTILAGCASIVLFMISVHDRVKYGPRRGR